MGLQSGEHGTESKLSNAGHLGILTLAFGVWVSHYPAAECRIGSYKKTDIGSDINNNKKVAAAFLDPSKYFDSLSHEILMEKLEDCHLLYCNCSNQKLSD